MCTIHSADPTEVNQRFNSLPTLAQYGRTSHTCASVDVDLLPVNIITLIDSVTKVTLITRD